jgi:hypothetical protein
MASRRVPASLPGRPQRCPHPPQGLPRRTPQLTGADLQNRVAEPGQERSALLLALPFLRQYQQLHDQRTLRAHVRNDERTDLAVSAETMGMQRRRLQQTAQSIVGGGHERRLMLRGREEGAINRQKKAEIEPKSCGPENWRRGSAPVATRCRRPQPANRGRARDVCAHAAMPRATLDAARIVCPLHRVNDRVETRTDQVAQMPSPTVFALHVSLRLQRRQFNAYRQNAVPVPTVCNIDSLLPPFSDGCSHPAVFTANWGVDHKPRLDLVTAMGPVAVLTGSRFLHMHHTWPPRLRC